ncbi:hypothetical protein D5S17_12120 [Pseudonocardiaceae bacterium YIM PH 21723]|nr:hypothetical protein D5S17_12120 [Pseudonocardiaceae bacterium YIM PH 21723]
MGGIMKNWGKWCVAATAALALGTIPAVASAAPDGPFTYDNDLPSLGCMVVAGDGHIDMAACDGSARQNWYREAVATGYQLRNQGTNQCVDVSAGATERAVQQVCTGAQAQSFYRDTYPNGRVRFRSVASPGLCLDGNRKQGPWVSLENCSDEPGQRWF